MGSIPRNWVLIAVGIVILYHYRSQLAALWQTAVAPKLAIVLPPSLASAVGAGAHPADIPAAAVPSPPTGTVQFTPSFLSGAGMIRQAPGTGIPLAVFDDPLELKPMALAGLEQV